MKTMLTSTRRIKCALQCSLVLGLAVGMSGITGCTPSEEDEAMSVLQNTLGTLTQNRTLVEQFARDVKTNVNPATPAYNELMESYEEARDSYNKFLEIVAASNGKKIDDQELIPAIADAQESTATFIQDAAGALDPTGELRGISVRRAIKMPANLQAEIHKMPKWTRKRLAGEFGGQVRWRSWGQL